MQKEEVLVLVGLLAIISLLGILAVYFEEGGITGAFFGVQLIDSENTAESTSPPDTGADDTSPEEAMPQESSLPRADSELGTEPPAHTSKEDTAEPATAQAGSSPTISEEQPKPSSGSLAPASIGILDEATSTTCGNVSNSLTLTANITFSPASTVGCMNISNSHVVLNGDGFALIGNGTGYGVNISSNLQNVTIKNLLIINFTEGIHLVEATAVFSNHTFINNTIRSIFPSSYGIYILNSGKNNITENTINASVGIYLRDYHNNTLFNNTINTLGGAESILIYDSSNNTIYKNTINSSGRAIDLNAAGGTAPNDNNITENTIHLPAHIGIVVRGSRNKIVGNTITSLASIGLSTANANYVNNQILYNTITANGYGIDASSYNLSNFTGNHIRTNGTGSDSTGIYLAPNAVSVGSHNFIGWNNITTVGATAPGMDIASATAASLNVTVVGNNITTSGTDADGIRVAAASGAFSQNIIVAQGAGSGGIEFYTSGGGTADGYNFSYDRINASQGFELNVTSPAGASAPGMTFRNILLEEKVNFTSSLIMGVLIEVNKTQPADPATLLSIGDFLTIRNNTAGAYVEFNLSHNATDA